MKKRQTAGLCWLKYLDIGEHLKIPSLLYLAQAANPLLAPLKFSTPLCKVRYQIMAVFAERCRFFCKKAARFNIDIENIMKYVAFRIIAPAFLERIRGPPSGIRFQHQILQKEVCKMADKEKYMIKVEGKLVEVSSEVYYAYFRMERQERWQEEKQQGHAVVSYDALDDGETVGMEAVPDLTSPSLKEMAISQDINTRLHHAIAALPRAERELIQAIYFEGMSERDYAKQKGISQRGANKQRRKIMSKLRMFLDIMGSF